MCLTCRKLASTWLFARKPFADHLRPRGPGELACEHGKQGGSLLIEQVRRIDQDQAGARELAAGHGLVDCKLQTQHASDAALRDPLYEDHDRARLFYWIPERVSSTRPFCMCCQQCAPCKIEFVGALERWVDQYDTAALLRRDAGV